MNSDRFCHSAVPGKSFAREKGRTSRLQHLESSVPQNVLKTRSRIVPCPASTNDTCQPSVLQVLPDYEFSPVRSSRQHAGGLDDQRIHRHGPDLSQNVGWIRNVVEPAKTQHHIKGLIEQVLQLVYVSSHESRHGAFGFS